MRLPCLDRSDLLAELEGLFLYGNLSLVAQNAAQTLLTQHRLVGYKPTWCGHLILYFRGGQRLIWMRAWLYALMPTLRRLPRHSKGGDNCTDLDDTFFPQPDPPLCFHQP